MSLIVVMIGFNILNMINTSPHKLDAFDSDEREEFKISNENILYYQQICYGVSL